MRTLAMLLYFIMVAILIVPLLALCALLEWPAPIIGIGRWAVRIGRRLAGVRLEVRGGEKIPRDVPCIFMPNHLSLLDGPLIYISISRFVRVIAKREIFRVPILGQGMRVVEFIPVDRRGRSGGRRAVHRAARLIRDKRYSFLVFPEGTRSRDGRLQAFRRGGFFLALQSGAPIVPVSISGTFPLLSPGRFFIRPGRVVIRFHAPVPVRGRSVDSMPELMAKVRERVRSGLEPEPAPPDGRAQAADAA